MTVPACVASYLATTRPFLVGGAWQVGAVVRDVVSPSDGAVIGRYYQASAEQVEAAVAAACASHADGRWCRRTPIERERVLRCAADLIDANAEELAWI